MKIVWMLAIATNLAYAAGDSGVKNYDWPSGSLADPYRPVPPDYRSADAPLTARHDIPLTQVQYLSPGGADKISLTPVAGWHPYQLRATEWGLPIPSPRAIQPTYSRRELEDFYTNYYVKHYGRDEDEAHGLAQDYVARNMAALQAYAARTAFRPGLTPAMRACFDRQMAEVRAFAQRFIASDLHKKMLRSGRSIEQTIQIRHVWTPGLRNVTRANVDLINNVVTVVPQNVNRGASCDYAKADEIMQAVRDRAEGRRHPKADPYTFEGDSAPRLPNLNVLMDPRH